MHWSASFRTPQPERADPAKVQKPSDMGPSTLILQSAATQRWQNYLNNFIRAKVGKELPNNSQNHLWPVNRTSVILTFIYYKNTRSEKYPKIIQGGSKSVVYCLINC